MSRAATVPGPGADEEPPGEEAVIHAVLGDPACAPPDPAADGIPPPADVPADDAAPQDTVSEDTATEDTATEDTATEDTAPEEVSAPRGRRRLRGAGIRERRRQQTRARIVDAAAELFAERGFDAVSVVEIAQRAGVVEKTVFNHFPVKEGLVFESDPPMRAALLDAVRRRPAGESVASAAGSFVVAAVSMLGVPEAASGVAEMAKVIRDSRTLQVREREILDGLTTALGNLVAEETRAVPGALEPWLAAHAVIGLYAALLDLARDRALAGDSGTALTEVLRARGERGLALLQFGLAGYAKRR